MGLFLSYPIRENKKTQPKFRTFDILQLGDISKLSTYSNRDQETEYKHSNYLDNKTYLTFLQIILTTNQC